MILCVPLFVAARADGYFVATYALQGMLSEFTSKDTLRGKAVALTEVDGTRLSLYGSVAGRRRTMHANHLLDLPGVTMLVRLESARDVPRLFPNVLTAMVSALSLALLGAASLPTWAWLVPLALLLLVYPLNAWRDAPLFPTPHHALQSLASQAPLPLGARVLDAGSGVGDGLKALRHAYPAAQLEGIEWSWPLRLLCALRCPWAKVRRADMWAEDWSPYRMVYLFQRPESMARAAAKAQAELATGAWLVSLEFAVPGVLPCAQLRAPGGRVVWLYRMPLNRVEA